MQKKLQPASCGPHTRPAGTKGWKQYDVISRNPLFLIYTGYVPVPVYTYTMDWPDTNEHTL